MKWLHVFCVVFMVPACLGQTSSSSERTSDYRAYSFRGGFGLGYGAFRFSGGLSETGLAYNLNLGIRVYRQISLGIEIGMWSPSPGSSTQLQLAHPTALLSYSLSNRLIVKAGAAFVSLEGNLRSSSKSWSGSDTSPGFMLGLSYDVPMGKHSSFVPSVQWMHQKIRSSDRQDLYIHTESGAHFVSVLASIWFH